MRVFVPRTFSYYEPSLSKMFGTPDRYNEFRIAHDLWNSNPELLLSSDEIRHFMALGTVSQLAQVVLF